jgi:hypothetical protein
MIKIGHYADGRLVNPISQDPNKPLKIELEMDWLNRKAQAMINVSSLEFEGPDGTLIRERFLSGLSGGVGVFEGMPYNLHIGTQANYKDFPLYMDFTKATTFFGTCGVRTSLQTKQGSDWLNDVAGAVSYRFLESEGLITKADFVDIPFVINFIPNGMQLLILGLSTYSLTKELIEGVKSISDRISDLTDAATPVIGISASVPPGIVTAYDIGNIIMAALKLVAQIAYLVAIVFALVKLVEQIIEQLMPPKRFHRGIPIRTLLQKFCDYKGLGFSSSLMDYLDRVGEKWCYMPPKRQVKGFIYAARSTQSGVPDINSVLDTPAGVIREFKKMFNADFKIVDGTLYFERKDNFRTQSPYIIPDTFTDQDKFQDFNGFNVDEFKANYNIYWSTDMQDQNTLDNVEGLSFQAQISPLNTDNPELTNLTGLEQVALPFALPIRKDKLTAVEEAVKVFAVTVDAVTGQLGNPQGLSGKINNRIGVLHLSSQYTNTGKFIVMSGDKLAKNQRSILSATSLYNKYHYINSFVPTNGEHNQYWTYEEQEIPFCYEDFVSLEGNNLVETQSGEPAEISLLKWDVLENVATISYRVNRLYDNNFVIKYL